MSSTAIFALYAAGLATFLSPCVLPLLPSYLSILGGADASRRAGLWRAGLGFAFGVCLVFVALGMGASALSLALSAHRRVLMAVAGGLMLLLGAKLVGLPLFSALDREARPLLLRVPSPRGFLGAALFGAAFALGWTPCVGPVLGATLSYAASRSSSPALAAAQLGVYALGLTTPLLVATFAAERVLPLARRFQRFAALTQRATGALLIVVGLLIATDRLDALAPTSAPARGVSSSACEVPGALACAVSDEGGATADEAAAHLPLGRPHLLALVGEHCPVCARMAPWVAKLERACTDGDGTVVHATLETPAGRALARRFGVHAVPTFLQLDAQGNEVERAVGEQTLAQLAAAFQSVSGTACRPL
jgi:cytochrome c-type biogenesis protein